MHNKYTCREPVRNAATRQLAMRRVPMRKPPIRKRSRFMPALLLVLACCPAGVAAGADAELAMSTPADPAAAWATVDDASLDQMRGGFDLGGGLVVSLGVERLVSINGELVASSNFSIADMAKLSAAEAQAAGVALSTATVVQNGPGNVVDPGLAMQGLGALLIQNSVNDQAIRSQTTINATVNNLSMLKALNFAGSLRDALNRVVGP